MKNAFAALILLITVFCLSMGSTHAATPNKTEPSDRAVEIAKRSRDRIERNGKSLKVSSGALFKAFAEKTVNLQKLIDTRKNLENAGLLTKGDPDGDARRAHINGKILVEVGELKKICDDNMESLLGSLSSFDDAVTSSLVDTQATRSINSNYELALSQYLDQEKKNFEESSKEAQEALESYQDADDPRIKEQLKRKYDRVKKRLLRVSQRRKLYEARVKVASMNQHVSGIIREKIRAQGTDISSRFRDVFANLYNTFSKITVIAEAGGTGTPQILSNLGFSNLEELNQTLDIVDGSISKLGNVLDDMVNDVLAGLGDIQVVDDNGLSEQSFSVDEEMEFLRKQREQWNS